MLAIRLPAEVEERLEALARATGRTKTFYAGEAILEYLDDLYLVEQRLIDIRAGRSKTYSAADGTSCAYGPVFLFPAVAMRPSRGRRAQNLAKSEIGTAEETAFARPYPCG